MKTLRSKLLFGVFVLCGLGWLTLRWISDSYDRPYCLVEERLYIGSSMKTPPPNTTVVVNLCGRKDPYAVKASLWEPVFEGDREPDLNWLRQVVKFTAKHHKAGETLYVHCMAGMNRSGAVVTAYLMQKHGWDRDTALAFVQGKRSQVQPNLMLMRLLSEWEKDLRNAPP